MPVNPVNPSPTAPTKANTVAGSLALLRRLEWKVNHAVHNLLGGEYRSVFRGRGMEFDQVVKYNFGDDIRDIDWNVTAKLGDAYRKKFIEERELTVIIVIEDTLSLQFGSGVRTKRDALFEIASLLMLLGFRWCRYRRAGPAARGGGSRGDCRTGRGRGVTGGPFRV